MKARFMNRPTDRPTDRPLAIDLFCGLGGWTEGLLAEGYRVVGFDIERHHYGEAKYPAQLVIQDVLTIHGRQFKDAALIVASPPCQEYSYMAMPWSKAKAIAADYRSGALDRKKLTALFDACFRIQAEAIKAAGHHIPLVVENVRGAQAWVGRSRFHFGSFHLWGDIPALMPNAKPKAKVGGISFSGYGEPGYKPVAFNGTADKRLREEIEGQKVAKRVYMRDGHSHARHLTNPLEHEGVKQRGSGREWFAGEGTIGRTTSSKSAARKSAARKSASAHIAKIPLVLSRHIARAWMPDKGGQMSTLQTNQRFT